MKEIKCPICNKTYEIDDDDFEMYSICDHCNWEYDPGVDYSNLNDYSDANHVTIGEAKEIAKNGGQII